LAREEKKNLGLPPQMNFVNLVLTDHFQKCVLSMDEPAQFGNFPVRNDLVKLKSKVVAVHENIPIDIQNYFSSEN